MKFHAVPIVILAMAASALAAPSTQPTSPKLKVSSLFPAANATSICVDTPLRITFAAAPALGSEGKIQILDATSNDVVEEFDVSSVTARRAIGGPQNTYVYTPVVITGNVAAIYPRAGVLALNKSYYVKIDPGVFKEDSGIYPGMEKPTEWKFTTKAAALAADAGKIIVAADGSGDFCTVQGAFDFIPAGNTVPRTIFVKKGTYPEMLSVTGKAGITLLGEDRKQTIIAYSNSAKENGGRRGILMESRCDDFTLANLTIHDTHPRGSGGTQAETIIFTNSNTARAVVTDVDLISFQDTLQINGQAFVSNTYIEGDVDFMWGRGASFFENCHCYCVTGGTYYTQIRNPANVHGFVYYRSIFDGKEGVQNSGLSQVAPNQYRNSEVVLIDCVVDKAVGDLGWRDLGAIPETLHYWEFNSHTPDGKPVDTSKRLAGSRQLKQPEDAELIANYSNPFWVLGQTWVPMTTRATTASVAAGQPLSFTAVVGAPPVDAKYQWQKDGKDIAGATGAVFTIPSLSAADEGQYIVIVSGGPSKQTSAAAKVTLAK